ncbi:hypothetical protein RUM43_011445 [Polyplax serrata]|uniref:Uncharacterized protein n=1 Tax=Polyplax serrata TaxID=468196 RepID=A0AAN8S3N9_POLSC
MRENGNQVVLELRYSGELMDAFQILKCDLKVRTWNSARSWSYRHIPTLLPIRPAVAYLFTLHESVCA